MKTNKFKSVSFNNRRRQILFVYAGGKKALVHYGQLGIAENISRVWIDKETKSQSVGMEFENGKSDYVPYDQPLALVRDAEYLLQNQIELLISAIKEEIKARGLSKKYLAQQLHTSDNQIQRLLNPAILNKNLSQLYQIVSLLNLELRLNIKKAA